MRKRDIVLIVILAIEVLIGTFFLVKYIDSRDDVTIGNSDYNTVLIVKDVRGGNVRRIGTYRYQFILKENVDFFEAVSSLNGYIYSIEENGEKSNKATGKYLLNIDNHYYCLELDNENSSIVYCTEMAISGSVFLPISTTDMYDDTQTHFYK